MKLNHYTGSKCITFSQHINFIYPLPNSILNITFNCNFDKPIPSGILPINFKYLDLGMYFQQINY